MTVASLLRGTVGRRAFAGHGPNEPGPPMPLCSAGGSSVFCRALEIRGRNCASAMRISECGSGNVVISFIHAGAPTLPKLRFPAIRCAKSRRQKFTVARKVMLGGIRRSCHARCRFGGQCFDSQQAPLAIVAALQTESRLSTQKPTIAECSGLAAKCFLEYSQLCCECLFECGPSFGTCDICDEIGKVFQQVRSA